MRVTWIVLFSFVVCVRTAGGDPDPPGRAARAWRKLRENANGMEVECVRVQHFGGSVQTIGLMIAQVALPCVRLIDRAVSFPVGVPRDQIRPEVLSAYASAGDVLAKGWGDRWLDLVDTLRPLPPTRVAIYDGQRSVMVHGSAHGEYSGVRADGLDSRAVDGFLPPFWWTDVEYLDQWLQTATAIAAGPEGEDEACDAMAFGLQDDPPSPSAAAGSAEAQVLIVRSGINPKLGLPTRLTVALVDPSEVSSFWSALKATRRGDSWWTPDPREKMRKDTTLSAYRNVHERLLPTEVSELPAPGYRATQVRLEWHVLVDCSCGVPPLIASGFPAGVPPHADLVIANKGMGTYTRFKAGVEVQELRAPSERRPADAGTPTREDAATKSIWVAIGIAALVLLAGVAVLVSMRREG